MAAARNVSAAAITTDLPSSARLWAIFPIVVVLPVPLTPTTRITCGRCSGEMVRGRATGSRISVTTWARAALISSSLISLSKRSSASLPLTRAATAGPRSAAINRSSSSSRAAASSFRLVKTAATELPILPAVQLKPAFKRENKPGFLSLTGPVVRSDGQASRPECAR